MEEMQMVTPTDIDWSAPVLARHETDIHASLDTVWRLHTDIDAWPTWNAEITAAQTDGPLAPGHAFTWTSYGFTITSTVYAVAEHSRTLWGGTGEGITATHEWRFDTTTEGVHVTTNESFAGQPVEADRVGMQTILDASLIAWLGRLKAAAESLA
jgi:hypothetical protein